MVRAYIKQPSEEKKSASKKRGATKAKETTLFPDYPAPPQWPCKLDGCTLKFQREADLKRHQRTAKVHGTSGAIPCPQCDASFTRGDALKRHQKSRHHGLLADPANSEYYSVADVNGKKGSSSSVRSSSVETTSRKDAEATSDLLNTTPSTLPVQTIVIRQENPGTSIGQQSYYRQTVSNTGAYYYPPTHNAMTGTFHTWTPWAPGSTSTSTTPTSTYYSPPGYYIPGAYYRSAHGQPLVPGPSPQGLPMLQMNSQPQAQNDASSSTEANSNEISATETQVGSAAQNEARSEDGGQENRDVDLSSIDVEKIVQVVLSIESKPGEGEETNPPTSVPSTAVPSELQLDPSLDNDKDLGTDIDADGEADLDGEGEYQEEEPLPDGIKELINEDSLV